MNKLKPNRVKYKNKQDHQSVDCGNKSMEIRMNVMKIIEKLSLKDGSFKVFVYNGNPGERVEIQSKALARI